MPTVLRQLVIDGRGVKREVDEDGKIRKIQLDAPDSAKQS